MREITISTLTGKVIFSLPDKCCAFCKHCTDIFYDYTNGPYLFFCDIDLNPSEWETCNGFNDIEEGEDHD